MIPEQFKFLEEIGPLPRMVEMALQYLGIREIPGRASNPIILKMAEDIGVSDIYKNDDTEWCAVFWNYIALLAGKPVSLNRRDRYDLQRSKQCALPSDGWIEVPIEEAALGDTVIISRPGGGHVTFLIGFTSKALDKFVGLGGNQRNTVNFSTFDSERIIRIMRFYKVGAPASAKQYIVEETGKVSTNEI